MTVKKHNISSFLMALLWPVVFYQYIAAGPIYRFMVSVFLLVGALYAWYAYRYLKKFKEPPFWQVMGLLLFCGALFGSWLLLPTAPLRQIHLLLSVPVLYFFFSSLGTYGDYIVSNRVLLTSFPLLMILSGLNQYFLIPNTVYLVLSFVAIYMLVRSSFNHVPHPAYKIVVSSVLFGLLVTESYWVLAFLPLHYSVIGFVLFSLFYACWSLYYSFLYGSLTSKKIIFHLFFAILLIVGVLIVTPWDIL